VISVTDYFPPDEVCQQVGQNPASIAHDKLVTLAAKLRANIHGMSDALTAGVEKFGYITESLEANRRFLHGLKHEVSLLADTNARSMPEIIAPMELKPSAPRLSDPVRTDVFLCTI